MESEWRELAGRRQGEPGLGSCGPDRIEAEIGPLGAGEGLAAAAVLASAFRDNPLNRAVVRGGPRRRLRANLHAMTVLLEHAAGPASLLAAREARAPAGDGIAGALVALPPFVYPLASPPLLDQLRGALRQGLGVTRRWGEVYRELAAVHPTEPHWYLGVLGVRPSRQGRGVGAALLETWLREVDSDPAPAYLETDLAENLAFYGRVGFEELASRPVMGVPIWLLWRDARPGRG